MPLARLSSRGIPKKRPKKTRDRSVSLSPCSPRRSSYNGHEGDDYERASMLHTLYYTREPSLLLSFHSCFCPLGRFFFLSLTPTRFILPLFFLYLSPSVPVSGVLRAGPRVSSPLLHRSGEPAPRGFWEFLEECARRRRRPPHCCVNADQWRR